MKIGAGIEEGAEKLIRTYGDMPLRLKFNKARDILKGLNEAERRVLYRICDDIRSAEKILFRESQPLLVRCLEKCKGLCCKNLDLDRVINLYDFIYLLAVEPGLKEPILNCLNRESLFTQNCIFLKNGKGPCIFPFDCRPEKCLTTFCVDDRPAGDQIRSVGKHFDRLYRFIRFRNARHIYTIFLNRFRRIRGGIL